MTFRLPNRKTTEDIEEFDKAWNAIIERLEWKYSLKVIGFYPGFTVQDAEGPSNATAHIPMWLAERMI